MLTYCIFILHCIAGGGNRTHNCLVKNQVPFLTIVLYSTKAMTGKEPSLSIWSNNCLVSFISQLLVQVFLCPTAP